MKYRYTAQAAGLFRNLRSNPVTLNAVFILATQIINYILPFIALKHLIRVLRMEDFGRISFAQTFAGYLIILVEYGFNISATREIATGRDHPAAIRRLFYQVMYAKGFLLLLSFLILLAAILVIPRFGEDAGLHLSFWGLVAGWWLFPQWYFQGVEKMGYITLVNALIKLVFTGCIVVFVKEEQDYRQVPLLYACSYVLPGMIGLYIAVKKAGPMVAPVTTEIIRLLSGGFNIFFTTATGAVLGGSAVFMLGFTTNNKVVGYYAGYERLIKAASMVFTPITVAVYPAVARKFAASYTAGWQYLKKIAWLTLLLAIFVAAGLIVFSGTLTVLLYDTSFLDYRIILYILSFWLVVSVANNFIGVHYLTATGKANLYRKSFTVAAVLSMPVLYLATLHYSYSGTAYAMLMSECLLTVLMLIYIKAQKK